MLCQCKIMERPRLSHFICEIELENQPAHVKGGP